MTEFGWSGAWALPGTFSTDRVVATETFESYTVATPITELLAGGDGWSDNWNFI